MGKKHKRTERHEQKKLADANEGLIQVLFSFGGHIAMREQKMTLHEIANIKNLMRGSDMQTVNGSISVSQVYYLARRYAEAVISECLEKTHRELTVVAQAPVDHTKIEQQDQKAFEEGKRLLMAALTKSVVQGSISSQGAEDFYGNVSRAVHSSGTDSITAESTGLPESSASDNAPASSGSISGDTGGSSNNASSN